MEFLINFGIIFLHWVILCYSPLLEMRVLTTFTQQLMSLQAQTRLNFLVEMQYKAATTATDSQDLEPSWGLGWVEG